MVIESPLLKLVRELKRSPSELFFTSSEWSASSVMQRDNRLVRIVYASETGTAEDLAYSLFGLLKRALSVNVTSMENYDVTKLPDEEIVVFVVSTTGDGDVPTSMLGFWKFLLQKHLSSTSLSSVEVDWVILRMRSIMLQQGD